MKSLRRSIVLLLINLAVFYNIERLDIGVTNIVNIPSLIYVLGIVSVVSVISIPFLGNSSISIPLSLCGILYVVAKFVMLGSQSSLDNLQVYIIMSEIVFLSISIVLAHDIARNLHDFEDAVENITFPDAKKRLRRLTDAQDDIKAEMLRSRRYGRNFAVAVIEPDPESVQVTLHHLVHQVQQALMGRYVFLGLARIINTKMRRMDMIFEEDDQRRLIVLCPETNADGIQTLVTRVQQSAGEQLGLSLSYGFAAFPDEALTFEEVVRIAKTRIHSPPPD